MWSGASQALLAAAGEQAKAQNVAFAVQLGDIAQGYCSDEAMQEKMLSDAVVKVKRYFPAMPLLLVGGNNNICYFPPHNDRKAADRVLPAHNASEFEIPQTGNGNAVIRHGKDLFIALDGFIPAKRLTAFVDKVLKDHPDARYVFVLTHLPLIPASPRFPFWLTPGYLEIADMLETRRAAVLAAHTHIPSLAVRTTPRGKVTQLVTSSMGAYWSPDKPLPPHFTYWARFVKAAKKVRQVGRNAQNPEKWGPLEAKGKYAMSEFFDNSGFAVLDIDDERVEARIYTDASGKPAKTVRLIENK